MDFSDISEPPVEEQQPPEEQQPTKLPYWKVLDHYRQAQVDEPSLKGMSLVDFANQMNTATGTKDFDEGLNDSALRRGGTNISNLTRHFGGFEPGSVLDNLGVPSPSKLFGGPQTGINLPEVAGQGAAALTEKLGGSPELGQTIGKGAGQFVEALPAIGAASVTGISGLAAVSGLETYGETGRKLPAAISATGAALIPKFMEGAGQTALRALGADTLAKAAPDLMKLLPEEKAAEFGSKFVPSGLVQRGAEFAGKQLGLTANMMGTQAAQTAVDPNMSWEDKLATIGHQFTPEGLLEGGIGQLPFTLMDLVSARTHPMRQARAQVEGEFKANFVKAHVEDTGEAPTKAVVDSAMNRVKTGQIIPDSTTSQVLASMGVEPTPGVNYTEPVKTTDDPAWNRMEAVNSVRDDTNRKLQAQGVFRNEEVKPLGMAHDRMIDTALRYAEAESKGSLSKDELTQLASNKVTDAWFRDQKDLNFAGDVAGEHPPFGTRGTYQTEQNIDAAISKGVDQSRLETYDNNLHQRMAFIMGDNDAWRNSGLPDPVQSTIWQSAEKGVTSVSPELGLQVMKEKQQAVPVSRNLVDLISGTGAKTYEKIAHLEQLKADEIAKNGMFTVRNGEGIPNSRVEYIDKKIMEMRQTDWLEGRQPVPTANFEARRTALNYGPVDFNNPVEVEKFARKIAAAVKNAKKEWGRNRGGSMTEKGPDGKSLKFKTREEAQQYITNTLEPSITGNEDYQINFSIPEKPEADKTFRIKRNMFVGLHNVAPETGMGQYDSIRRAGTGDVGARIAEAPEGEPSEATEPLDIVVNLGPDTTIKDLENEMFMKQFKLLGEEKDPGTREGRKAALAKNFADYTNSLSDSVFADLIKVGTGNSVRDTAKLKQQMIKFVQFLRDDGQIRLVTTKTTKDLVDPKHLADLKRQFVQQAAGEEVTPAVVPGRIVGEGDLDLFNQYAGEHGYGQYPATHKQAGKERSSRWNEASPTANFFEKFAIFSKHLQKEMFDPRTGLPNPEYRPLGDYAWLTPEFRKNIESKVVKDWSPELTRAVGSTVTRMEDRDGNVHRHKITVNPIYDTILRSTQHDLTTKASDILDLFRRFGNIPPALMNMADALVKSQKFVGDQRVGFSITRDPLNRGYFHTDSVFSSGGVLVDPYIPTANGKLRMMTPAEMFPHLLEELGHSAVDFAWHTDAGFKKEVTQIHEYLVNHHKGLTELMGSDNKFLQDQLLALRDPREMLAAMFKDGQFHEWLKDIPDPFPPLFRTERTGSMFDRLWQMIKGLFTKWVGPEGADTMLSRLAETASRGIEIQKQMNLSNVFWEDGMHKDIYRILGEKGALAGGIIETPPGQPVPKPVEPTQTYYPFKNRPLTDLPPEFSAETKQKIAEGQQQLRAAVASVERLERQNKQDPAAVTLADIQKAKDWVQKLRNTIPVTEPTYEPPATISKIGGIEEAHMGLIGLAEQEVARLKYAKANGDVTVSDENIAIAEQHVKVLEERRGHYREYGYTPEHLNTQIRDVESAISDAQVMLQASETVQANPQLAARIRQHIVDMQGALTNLQNTKNVRSVVLESREPEDAMQRLQEQVAAIKAGPGTPFEKSERIKEVTMRSGFQPMKQAKGQVLTPEEEATRLKQNVGSLIDKLKQRFQQGSNLLESRSVPDEQDSSTNIPKPIFHIAGRKGTLLKDKVVNRLVASFTRDAHVVDAFAGSGQLSQFAKRAGARSVTLNVRDPQMQAVFEEIKNNTDDFARRVANAVRPINAPRDGVPTLINGEPIIPYLQHLSQTDPNVALLLKQNFNAQGRSVTATKFTPSIMITNTGLKDLPSRIKDFAMQVDHVQAGDGWQAVANAQRGQRVMVDPPYVGQGRMYEPAGKTSVEQRLAEYQQYMFPAAQRGAEFLVFDAYDPRLAQALTDNGFTVQPVQRTNKGTNTTRQELIAFNHGGSEVLESRVRPEYVIDSMKQASTHMTEDEDRNMFFKPYNLAYFRRTFGPAFGNGLQLTQDGGQWGYLVRRMNAENLTVNDVSRMPAPRVKPWAPSLFETVRGLFTAQGSDAMTSDALANYVTRFGALLKNTDQTKWGVMTQNNQAIGLAWWPDNIVGLSSANTGSFKQDLMAKTVRHESAHTAGVHSNFEYETPDVRLAVKLMNTTFEGMTPDQRKVALEAWNILTGDNEARMHFPAQPKAIIQPQEFAAEFMATVGANVVHVPSPSVYFKEMMRFAPDEVSNLVRTAALRRMQSLETVADYTKKLSEHRGVKDAEWLSVLTNLAKGYRGIARSALEIAEDISEFQRARLIFPDTYQGLLQGVQGQLDLFAAQDLPDPAFPPRLPQSSLLESRMGNIEKMVRGFFRLPTSGGYLPTKISIWDQFLRQFHQFVEKYPAARPFYDMLGVARATSQVSRLKIASALAGKYEGGGQTLDDARTKMVASFVKSPAMREKFSKIALDLNTYGDFKFDKERAAMKDVMQMDPERVTGWMTPTFIDALMKKYGVTDAEKPIIQNMLTGTRSQMKMISANIVEAQHHAVEVMVARAVSMHTNLNTEEARKTAKGLMDGFKVTQLGDPQTGFQRVAEFQAKINDPEVFGKIFDLAQSGHEGAQQLQRFLELRMPYFMSERRPGSFGVIWRDTASDQIRSQYFASAKDRQEYIDKNKITPVRQTSPNDRSYGVSDTVMRTLEEAQTRMEEKLSNLFGEQQARDLATVLDYASELRNALNARDVLRMTTGRELAPGREELDMFLTSQHYLNATSAAIRNRFIKLESELLMADPSLANEPDIRAYVDRHIKAIMTPDSPIGRQMQQLGFLYYLWGNPSSMLMQFSDHLMTLAPLLTSRGAGVVSSFNLVRKAAQMTLQAKIGKAKSHGDAEIDAMVKRAEAEGAISSWASRELDYNQDLSMVNRMRVTQGKPTWEPFDLLKNKVYQGYSLVRQFYDIIPLYNSQTAFVASILHLRSKAGGGLTGDALYNEAKFLKDLAVPPGGKETRPGLFQYLPRSAAQSIWSLQTFVNNMTTLMGDLIRKSLNPKGAGLTPAQGTQVRKAAAQMLITQVAVAGVLGLPFTRTVLFALQKMFPDHDFEHDVRDALASLGGDDEAMGQLISSNAMLGIPSSMSYAPDLGSRYALSGVFYVSPYSGTGWDQMVGPTGSIMTNVARGLQAGAEGQPLKTVQSLMPVGAQRIWQSLEQGHNYMNQSGQMITNDLKPEEIVARMLGFRPARIARIEEFRQLVKTSEDAAKADLAGWSSKQVRLLKDGQDSTVRQNIAQRVADTKGAIPAQELANKVGQEYEDTVMPIDLKKYGSRATVLAQKSIQGALGKQSEGPSHVERTQLQQQIAQRLGMGGPKPSAFRRASAIDRLMELYPQLTTPQANLLLIHAARSRPSPELYSELTTGNE